MGIPSFFKTPRNKQFSYSPLYFDERKEELERIKKENGVIEKDETTTSNIKGQFRAKFRKKTSRKASSNIRLVAIIIILFLIAYYFLLR